MDKLNFLKECAIKQIYRLTTMKRFLRQQKNKRGQTLVEYALILAFISVVAISVLINVGTNLKAVYSKIDSGLSSAQASH